MASIALIAWLVAVAIAVVVLGLTAYDLLGKIKRLRRDLGRLQGLGGELAECQARLADTQQRLAASGVR